MSRVPRKPAPGPHPLPPPDLPSRELPIVTATGPWFRLHRAGRDPLHFGRSAVFRFDDPEGQYGVLYVGEDPHCAFIETFGRGPNAAGVVTLAALAERELARVDASQPLRLVDLTGPGLARLGADGRLCSGDYVIAQVWARAFWAHPSQPDGILYRSRHDPSRACAAIFDRAAPFLQATRLPGLADPANRSLLAAILDAYGFGLI